eukprot:COSAG02_NODE_1898_length_10461_cov_3.844528_9_plen_129_part_00
MCGGGGRSISSARRRPGAPIARSPRRIARTRTLNVRVLYTRRTTTLELVAGSIRSRPVTAVVVRAHYCNYCSRVPKALLLEQFVFYLVQYGHIRTVVRLCASAIGGAHCPDAPETACSHSTYSAQYFS